MNSSSEKDSATCLNSMESRNILKSYLLELSLNSMSVTITYLLPTLKYLVDIPDPVCAIHFVYVESHINFPGIVVDGYISQEVPYFL